MAFDPDSYLNDGGTAVAEPPAASAAAGAGFDPDAYLAGAPSPSSDFATGKRPPMEQAKPGGLENLAAFAEALPMGMAAPAVRGGIGLATFPQKLAGKIQESLGRSWIPAENNPFKPKPTQWVDGVPIQPLPTDVQIGADARQPFDPNARTNAIIDAAAKRSAEYFDQNHGLPTEMGRVAGETVGGIAPFVLAAEPLAALGPVGQMMGAGVANEPDPAKWAQAAAGGALTGLGLGAAGKIPAEGLLNQILRRGAAGAAFAGPTALGGGSPEDTAVSALMGGMFGPGGRRGDVSRGAWTKAPSINEMLGRPEPPMGPRLRDLEFNRRPMDMFGPEIPVPPRPEPVLNPETLPGRAGNDEQMPIIPGRTGVRQRGLEELLPEDLVARLSSPVIPIGFNPEVLPGSPGNVEQLPIAPGNTMARQRGLEDLLPQDVGTIVPQPVIHPLAEMGNTGPTTLNIPPRPERTTVRQRGLEELTPEDVLAGRISPAEPTVSPNYENRPEPFSSGPARRNAWTAQEENYLTIPGRPEEGPTPPPRPEDMPPPPEAAGPAKTPPRPPKLPAGGRGAKPVEKGNEAAEIPVQGEGGRPAEGPAAGEVAGGKNPTLPFEQWAKENPAIKQFQPYSSEQRTNMAASRRLGHNQRNSVGEAFYTHPLAGNIAFDTRGEALRSAYEKYKTSAVESPPQSPAEKGGAAGDTTPLAAPPTRERPGTSGFQNMQGQPLSRIIKAGGLSNDVAQEIRAIQDMHPRTRSKVAPKGGGPVTFERLSEWLQDAGLNSGMELDPYGRPDANSIIRWLDDNITSKVHTGVHETKYEDYLNRQYDRHAETEGARTDLARARETKEPMSASEFIDKAAKARGSNPTPKEHIPAEDLRDGDEVVIEGDTFKVRMDPETEKMMLMDDVRIEAGTQESVPVDKGTHSRTPDSEPDIFSQRQESIGKQPPNVQQSELFKPSAEQTGNATPSANDRLGKSDAPKNVPDFLSDQSYYPSGESGFLHIENIGKLAAAGAKRGVKGIQKALEEPGRAFVNRPERDQTLAKSETYTKDFAPKIDRANFRMRQIQGDLAVDNRLGQKGLTGADRKWAKEHFEQYIAEGKPMPNARLQQYAKAWKTITDKVARIAEGMGKTVESGASGRQPFRRMENYFPHVLTPEAREALTVESGPLYDALAAAAKKANIDLAPYAQENTLGTRERKAGAVDFARLADLPAKVTGADGTVYQIRETDPFKVMDRHIANVSRRLANAEVWGDTGQETKFNALREKIIKETGQTDSRRMLDHMWTDMQGNIRDAVHPFVREAFSLSRAAQLSLSGLSNAVGGLTIPVSRFGYGNTAKSAAEATYGVIADKIGLPTGRLGQHLEQAERNGGWRKAMIGGMSDTEGIGGKVGLALTKASMTEPINRQINRVAALAGERAFFDFLNKKQTPKGADALKREFGFTDADIERMRRDGPTQDDLARVHQKATTTSNVFAESALTRPPAMDNPYWRRVLAYTSYARAAGWAVSDAVHYAKQGRVGPLARLMLQGTLAGAALETFRNWLTGRTEKDRGWWTKLADWMNESSLFGVPGSISTDAYYSWKLDRDMSGIAQAEWWVDNMRSLADALQAAGEKGPAAGAQKAYLGALKTIPALKVLNNMGLKMGLDLPDPYARGGGQGAESGSRPSRPSRAAGRPSRPGR